MWRLLPIPGLTYPAVTAVRPETAQIPILASEWAAQALRFEASPIQKQVLDQASNRLLLCCNRQWGKSTIIAIKALHHALRQPGSDIIVMSRSKNQAGIVIEKMSQFTLAAALSTRRVQGYQHSLQLLNGSRLYAIAHSSETSPGRTADVLIVDEAAMVRDNVFGVIAPFVARSKGAIWLLSTPRGQTGFFYAFWHASDLKWTRIRSTVEDCPGIDRDFLDMQRRIFPATFRQEFYCEFTPAPGRLISRERLRAILDPNLKPL